MGLSTAHPPTSTYAAMTCPITPFLYVGDLVSGAGIPRGLAPVEHHPREGTPAPTAAAAPKLTVTATHDAPVQRRKVSLDVRDRGSHGRAVRAVEQVRHVTGSPGASVMGGDVNSTTPARPDRLDAGAAQYPAEPVHVGRAQRLPKCRVRSNVRQVGAWVVGRDAGGDNGVVAPGMATHNAQRATPTRQAG